MNRLLRRTVSRVAPTLAVGFLAAIFVVSSAPAASAASSVGLTASTAATVQPGEPVRIHFVVRNNGSVSCDLSTYGDGSLQVLSATRGGVELHPTFGPVLPIDGTTSLFRASASKALPGETVAFDESIVGPNGMTLVTPLRDHTADGAYWPVNANGTYTLKLLYAMPSLASSTACSGESNVVTVSYTVGNPARTPWSWIAIGIGGLVVIAAGVLVLTRSRRGGKAAAVAVLAFTALAGSFAAPRPASSTPVAVPPKVTPPPGALDQYSDCLGYINGFDPDLMPYLNAGQYPVTIELTGGKSEIQYADPPPHLVIKWNNTNTGIISGDLANLDPCAELFHELFHAKDFDNGSFFAGLCAPTTAKIEELLATKKENEFRAYLVKHNPADANLEQRTNYDGVPLPPTIEACTPYFPPPPPPPKNGELLANAGGKSNGDPHITTFDGSRYDFQAVGEFTAAISPSKDFDIQVRQAAYQTSRQVAVNSAIAMKVSGTRVGFYLDDGQIVVHRDGATVVLPDGATSLPGGVVVRSEDPYLGPEYTVTWSDGSAASVWRAGVWGLVLTVAPATPRAGALAGLLGNFNGNPTDDVAPRGKAAIIATFASLYPAYADSWRITDAESLFDYPKGDNTETFTDRTFPDKALTAASLTASEKTAANSACISADVSDATDLADCELDVASTGSTDFAASSGDLEAMQSANGSTSGPGASPIGSGAVTQTATVTAATPVARVSFTATKGQRAYVGIVSTTLPRQCGTVLLRGPDDNVLAEGCSDPADPIDDVILPANGTYEVDVHPSDGVTGIAKLQVVLSHDQTLSASIDGPSVTASVKTIGAVTNVTFPGKAGQSVFVDLRESTFPSQCGAVSLDGPGDSRLALGCVIDGTGDINATTLPSTGKYSIVVDPSGAGIGSVMVRIIGNHDQTATATIGGPGVTETVSQPGSTSRITFHGDKGQAILVEISGSTLPNMCGAVALKDPSGSTLTTGCVIAGVGVIPSLALPATGDYSIVLDPSDQYVGSLVVRVISSP